VFFPLDTAAIEYFYATLNVADDVVVAFESRESDGFFLWNCGCL